MNPLIPKAPGDGDRHAARAGAAPRPRLAGAVRRLVMVPLVLAAAPAGAQVVQERIDLGALARIREEAFQRSQVMEIAGYLTDVIGPRPQGSTNLFRANRWVADRLRAFGLSNVTVEPWGRWGRGWERVRFAANITQPWPQPLVGQPMAWSGSTRGPVRGPVVILEATDSASFQPFRGTLRGAFVLLGEPPATQSTYADPPVPSMAMEWPTRNRRYTEADLHAPDLQPAFTWSPLEVRLARRRAGDRYGDLVRQLGREGIAALLVPSTLPYGLIRVAAIPGWHDIREARDGEPVAAVVVAHDQYGQMYRNVRRGVPVEIEADIRNRFLTDDLDGYNTLAELPGTDLADQVVMLGGHLDSWHAGTGATDNAAGVAVAMEAMRILRALGLNARRTIRVGLWTAEEGRHLGVAGWIARHRDQWSRISVYLNLDTGHGRIRGVWNQSNAAAVPIFRQVFEPLRELGVAVVREGNVGGNEHQDFDDVGIPGFSFLQDPMEYVLRSHHSSADTFERLVEDDLQQAATVLAWTAWTLANRDAMMPRKP
jgi:carboxypeptidase Q